MRNRLEASVASMTSASITTELAIGRILDADVASEMAKLVKTQLLQAAATQLLRGAQLSRTNIQQLLKI
jgi:flagellin-like hook-associated protein FlgL